MTTLSCRPSLCLALALVVFSTGEPLARAQPNTDVEDLIRAGVELRRKGDDKGAVEQFRRAYEKAPMPRAAAQLGLAEQAVKRWVDSHTHLTEALAYRNDPWIKKNLAVLESMLQKATAEIGRLQISGDPPGAEVFVNGNNVGRLPLTAPVRVEPGSVRVELRSFGYTSAAMTVKAIAGQSTHVDIRLEREPPAPPPDTGLAPPPGGGGAEAVATTPRLSPPPAPRESPPPALTLRPTPAPRPGGKTNPSPGLTAARWVVLGATGLFVATGVGGVITHETRIGKFNDACEINPDTRKPTPTAGGTAQLCQDFLDDANTGKKVAIVGFVGAGLLAATSALLFFAF